MILKGICNCKGWFKGVLKKYNTKLKPSDYQGKVIYLENSINSILDYFPYIKGVVIKEGGVLSHVAIVAREFNMLSVLGVDFNNYFEDEMYVKIVDEKIKFANLNLATDCLSFNQITNYNLQSIISRKLIDKFAIYSLKEIKYFYDNTFSYNDFLRMNKKSVDYRVKKYVEYMITSTLILKYIKTEINKISNFDDIIVTKKIISAHLKAIIDAKKVDLNSKEEVTEFGFYYGWMDRKNYTKNRFYVAGKNIINKLKFFDNTSEIIEEKNKCVLLAKYYEWRKLLWMRLFLLINGVDDKIIINKIDGVIKKYEQTKTLLKLRD